MGIKTLLEKGQFPTSQFTDLVHREGPPIPETVLESIHEQAEGARSAAQIYQDQKEEEQVNSETASRHNVPAVPGEAPADVPEESAASSAYGLVRRLRHRYKSPEEPLHRPSAMAHDDLVDILQEAIPRMIDDHLDSASGVGPDGQSSSSPRGDSSKREASAEPETQRESSRPRVEDSVESLLCQVAEGKATMNVEALTAAFLQKKLQKEIPASGNEPSLQAKVDESKALEWETLL